MSDRLPELRLETVLPEAMYDRLVHDVTARVLAELYGRNAGSPWLSEAEAADHLRVSKRTVQRMVAQGRVRSTTIGRRRLLHRDDLDQAATGEEIARTTPPRHREG